MIRTNGTGQTESRRSTFEAEDRAVAVLMKSRRARLARRDTTRPRPYVRLDLISHFFTYSPSGGGVGEEEGDFSLSLVIEWRSFVNRALRARNLSSAEIRESSLALGLFQFFSAK